MKRDEKKALRKAARFVRSRAEHPWDARTVLERVFGPITLDASTIITNNKTEPLKVFAP